MLPSLDPHLLSLLTLVAVHLLAVASPGPAFVAVIQTSGRNPFRITLMHILGLGLASALWALPALFGMEQLFVRAPKAHGTCARAKAAIERTAGTVMLLFGLKLVWDARRSA